MQPFGDGFFVGKIIKIQSCLRDLLILQAGAAQGEALSLPGLHIEDIEVF